MSEYNKLRYNAILLSCCIIIVIAAAIFIGVSISAGKNDKEESDRTIVYIDDHKINENQFKFFARIILNQEEDTVKNLYTSQTLSAKDEIKKYTSNFAYEYIVRLCEAEKAGVKITDEEKASLEKQFETDYENTKEVDGKILDKEEFYEYYYGISEEEYKDFWTNWFIIDKYTTQCENNADTSEDTQEKAFAEYYDYLYTYHTSVIVLSVDKANTKEIQTEKANSILTSLNSGREFADILKENTTEEQLLKTEGKTDFYPAQKYEYSEIYDWLRSSNPGDTGVVITETAVYVLRLDSITDFELLKNTEKMIEWTRTFAVNLELNELLDSDKYKYEVVAEVYNQMDLSGILEDAYEYWLEVWENDTQ